MTRPREWVWRVAPMRERNDEHDHHGNAAEFEAGSYEGAASMPESINAATATSTSNFDPYAAIATNPRNDSGTRAVWQPTVAEALTFSAMSEIGSIVG